MAVQGKIILASLMVLLAVAGCASPRLLAPAPSLYTVQNGYPQDGIAAPYREPRADMIFVTDRVWDDDNRVYTAQRSRSMTAGQVVVDIGQGTSWEDLMDLAAGSPPSRGQPELSLSEIDRQIRFPETPLPYRLVDGVVVEEADIAEAYQASRLAFQDLVRRRLLDANTDTVLFYVHGFNTGFDDAAFDLTDIWHSSGRGAAPVVFSWPTVEGNLLGYFSARESGEFSIFHLKETLRALRDMDEVRAINIIAHSRGVDVTTSALRELIIEVRASGRSPRQVLKLENLIFAAADLDVSVAYQRLGAERFALAVEQITFYSNPDDAALRLSSLVSSGLRVGRSTRQSYDENFGDVFLGVENIAFVRVTGLPGGIGHSYFRLNPRVIADIATVLQTGARPGDPSRGLRPVAGPFYELSAR
ncbi:alpha/beta hydrolase [Maricaulaceae bacterium MS644]